MKRRARSVREESGDPAWVVEGTRGPFLLRRRRGDRRPVPQGVHVREPDLEVTFEAFDLSGHGVFVCSELLPSLGDRLRLEIARDGGPAVVVDGEIVEVAVDPDEGRGGAGAGALIAFRDVGLGDLETLAVISSPVASTR